MPWPLLGCAFTLRSTGHSMHRLSSMASYRPSVPNAWLASHASCRLNQHYSQRPGSMCQKYQHISVLIPTNDRVSRHLARSCRKPATIPKQTSAKPWGLDYPCVGATLVKKGNTTQRLAVMQVCFSTNSVLRQLRMPFLAHFTKAAVQAFTVAGCPYTRGRIEDLIAE